MDQAVPRRRRARPVGDAPIDALLARVEDLTKGWLVALLEQTPLEQASAILAAELVRDGPHVCDAVIRALADERDLSRLAPGGALERLVSRAGDLSGGGDPAVASATIDALQAVIWTALREELHSPEPDQVSELAQRLALVMEYVRGAALRRLAQPEAPVRPLEAVRGWEEQKTEPGGGEAPEHEDPRVEPQAPHGGSELTAVSPDPEALWVGALEEETARAERSGAALSLLLVEMEDGERVRSIESPEHASATLGRFAQAVRDAVRRPDLIASESDARAWVIARETGRAGAQALAARLGASVRSAEPWRGAPLGVTIGIAVLGEDGRDARSLIGAAEESRFAAAASGVEVVRAGSGDGHEQSPEDSP